MTRLGRPRGSIGDFGARALELATSRPVSYYDLHCELGMSRAVASYTLRNLLAAGHVEEITRAQVPGARKPVPVVRAKPPASVEDKLAALMAWPRSTAGVVVEPA